VILDDKRPLDERVPIEAFKESISDFKELPSLIDRVTTLIGINNRSTSKFRAFAKDILSIEIEGPSRS